MGTGAFQQGGKQSEDGGGITLGRRRLSCRETDFTLCHRKAGDRIHCKQHILFLVAEIFCNGGGNKSTAHSQQGRLVRSRNNDDGALHPFFTEVVLDEFPDFLAPFTDQGNDVDVGIGVACHHPEQYRFTDPGTGQDSHTLPPSAGQAGVDDLDSDIKGVVDPFPLERIDHFRIKFDFLGQGDFSQSLQGSHQRVDDPSQKSFSNRHHRRPVVWNHPAAGTDSVNIAEGHDQHPVFAETDYFCCSTGIIGRIVDGAHSANRTPRIGGFNHVPNDLEHFSFPVHFRKTVETLDVGRKGF